MILKPSPVPSMGYYCTDLNKQLVQLLVNFTYKLVNLFSRTPTFVLTEVLV